MPFIKDQLLLDRVRSASYDDLTTGKLITRWTKIEDATLGTSADGEEIVDNVGALITTLYRAKRATLSFSNSLLSFSALSIQYGTEREVADTGSEIIVPQEDILTVDSAGKIKTKYIPDKEIKYIYELVSGDIARAYVAGSTVSATEFTFDPTTGEIEVPTGVTGKIYVKYKYSSANAMRVRNRASKFPEAGILTMDVIFRDSCNENMVYAGKIICPKAKVDPSSIELALTSTGKHPITFNMMKDYCAEEDDDELFSFIIVDEN